MLQGEWASGKTIVGSRRPVIRGREWLKVGVLAPTEIMASQHTSR